MNIEDDVCEYRRWCFEYVLIFCQHFCQCWYEMWQKSIQLWKQATPDVQIRPNIDFLCKYCRTLTKLFHIVYKDILFRFLCKEFVSRLCVKKSTYIFRIVYKEMLSSRLYVQRNWFFVQRKLFQIMCKEMSSK